MNRPLAAGVTLVLSCALVASCTGGTPGPSSGTASGPPATPATASAPGGALTGEYPNLFARAGYSEAQVDARIDAAWQQLFHGSPGEKADRSDGQTLYYPLAPDTAYVEDVGNQDVRTEGIGYAMMIAVQLDHRTEFDALWRFAKTHMQLAGGPAAGFFAWHTDPAGTVIDEGVAPDGDQWIAAALFFASGRWGDGSGILDYGSESHAILHAMWHQNEQGNRNMFDAASGLPVFSPPDATGFTDPSYALPAFYRVFAQADPEDEQRWDAAHDAAEALLQKAYDPSTGLAPCYASFDGTPFLRPGETASDDAYDHTFQEDAWRVIANVDVDAAWFGVQDWQTQYANTLERFFEQQGIVSYAGRYHLDGTPVGVGQNDYEPTHPAGLVAMNATSAISATDAHRDDFVRDLWTTSIPTGQGRYYDGLLYLLGLLYDSGRFRDWAPGAPGAPTS